MANALPHHTDCMYMQVATTVRIRMGTFWKIAGREQEGNRQTILERVTYVHAEQRIVDNREERSENAVDQQTVCV